MTCWVCEFFFLKKRRRKSEEISILNSETESTYTPSKITIFVTLIEEEKTIVRYFDDYAHRHSN